MPQTNWILLFFAGLWAGTQTALAGGGGFVSLPALILSGLSPRAANITSTVALFPAQAAAGLADRRMDSGAEGVSFRTLFVVSLFGGAVGATLLLLTPASFFARLVPWLVMFATGFFIWESFFHDPGQKTVKLGPLAVSAVQFVIAVYGGYYGGGIGLLMLAALTAAKLEVHVAEATKNILAAVMNASAIVVFIFAGEVHWLSALVLGAGAIGGGLLGVWLLGRVQARPLRIAVAVLGVALTVGLFVRPTL